MYSNYFVRAEYDQFEITIYKTSGYNLKNTIDALVEQFMNDREAMGLNR